jgi:osmoprotectant transport system substrate-binding protein
MKQMVKVAAVLFAAALFVLAPKGVSAGGNNDGGAVKKAPVRIGSKDFTESLILAEIYALALENAGIPVERKFNLAGSVVHTSLVNKAIDLYPEYTGTGLLSVLKLGLITDPKKVYDTVKSEYKKRFDIVWLNYAEANDGQGIAITKAASDQYGILTISDLQKNAGNIRFASQGEFDEREDALPGLAKVYGPFNWKSTQVYANSLKYQVLLSNEADAAPAYTTEGQLADSKFVLLQDDKQVWPPYNIAPVIRQETLTAYPAIADVLNKVNAKITTAGITALNAYVDIDKKEFEDVAKQFFDTAIKGK